MECINCGAKTTSPTMVKDNRWSLPMKPESPLCPTCFNFWAVGEDQKLFERRKQKFYDRFKEVNK